jgi:alpha-beta hydrolase superfamily lysophospholipase
MKNFIKKLLSSLLLAYFILIGFGFAFSDQLIFLPQVPSYTLSDQHISIDSKSTSNEKTTNQIIIKHIENPLSKYTILYSHGIAVDLGGLRYLQNNFYNHGYSIVTYDYSGYGHSKGRASEQQVYNDVQAVYDYLLKQKNISADRIISYGHSLGAAIATDLAYKNSVAALVLESPFTTAFRVKTIYPIAPFDKFASIDKIQDIHVPVFISHSKDDRVIAFWHGEELFGVANSPKKFLSLETKGHAGITHSTAFWSAFETFISSL